MITGKCPWCGELLAPNYTVLLPEVIRRAERGGSELESALKMLTGSWVPFRINPESVLEPIREELGTIEEEAEAKGDLREICARPPWAEHQSPESIEEAWGTANARIGTLERELRDVAAVSPERDRNAAREVEAASDALAASAGGESVEPPPRPFFETTWHVCRRRRARTQRPGLVWPRPPTTSPKPERPSRARRRTRIDSATRWSTSAPRWSTSAPPFKKPKMRWATSPPRAGPV